MRHGYSRNKLEILDWVMHLKDLPKAEKVLALKAEPENEIVAYTAVVSL